VWPLRSTKCTQFGAISRFDYSRRAGKGFAGEQDPALSPMKYGRIGLGKQRIAKWRKLIPVARGCSGLENMGHWDHIDQEETASYSAGPMNPLGQWSCPKWDN